MKTKPHSYIFNLIAMFGLMLAALLVLGTNARAAIVTWTGGAGTLNWATGGNWSTGAMPPNVSDIQFNGGAGNATVASGSTVAVNIAASTYSNTSANSLTFANGAGFTLDFGAATAGVYPVIKTVTVADAFAYTLKNNTTTAKVLTITTSGSQSFGVATGGSLSLINRYVSNGACTVEKTGGGVLDFSGLTGYEGYGATALTVSAGTVVASSFVNISTATVQSSGKLMGSGVAGGGPGTPLGTGNVTLQSGGTLGAGTPAAIGTLSINGALTLNAGSTVQMRINKTGSTLTADKISMTGTTGIAYTGTLTVNASGDALAAGDTFTLFSKAAGTFTGSFGTTNLPSPGTGLGWDTSQLTVNGSIQVVSLSTVVTPTFNPVAGGYVGAQAVSISTITAGATIYYTTDGSTPTTGSAVYSTPVSVPVPTASMTIKAFAIKAGSADSAVATAVYSTVTTPTWTNLSGGSWATAANWLNSVAASGSGVTADFSQLTLTANRTVTLDGPQTIGTLLFDDQASPKNTWTLSTGSGGPLTLAGAPVISNNAPVIISAVIAGTEGLTKTGNNTLAFSGNNTYSGTTTVNNGTLRLDYSARSAQVDASAMVKMAVASGATLEILSGTNTADDATYYLGTAANYAITGSGTLLKTGAGNFEFYQVNGPAAFTGLIDVQAGILAFNGPAWQAGAGAMNLLVESGAVLDVRTSTVGSPVGGVKVNQLTGLGTIGRSTGGAQTLAVGCNNGSSTFDGILANLIPGHAAVTGAQLAFTKTGTGTQILSGANTYTGATTVNNGILLVNGSLAAGSAVTIASGATLGGTGTVNGTVTAAGTLAGSGTVNGAVTVQSGGTLAGSGIVAGAVTVQSGGTLASSGTLTGTFVSVATGAFLKPAGDGTIGTLTVDSALTLAGNIHMDIHKAGTTLTNDQIAGTGSVTVSGSLTLTASGDTLALNDEFQIFNVTGGISGGLSALPDLPSLPAGLSWDTTNLLTTGIIRVADFVGVPFFSPPAGGYVGTPPITITSDPGSTIYYTVDGSEPTTASLLNGPSPLDIGALPANTTDYTVKAFAIHAGQGDSPVVSATYNTADTPTWSVNDNGNWSVATNWLRNVIPDGSGVTADFNTTDQSAATTITLDGSRTVGGMTFGNANVIDWSLNPTVGSVLTLATSAATPVVNVINHTATVSVPLAGTQGLIKAGAGTLVLSGVNTYTGGTTVSDGTLATGFVTANLGGGTAPAVLVASGATLTLSGAGGVTEAAAVTLAAGSTLNLTVTSGGNSLLANAVQVTGNTTINLSHTGTNYRGNGFILNSIVPVNVTVNGGSGSGSGIGWMVGGDYGYGQGSSASGSLAAGSVLTYNGNSTAPGVAYVGADIYFTTAVGRAVLASTDLIIGNASTTAGTSMLLAGSDGGTTQVNSLAGGLASLTLVASDNHASVLQINNGTTAGSDFAGIISDGTGVGAKISLVKNGTGKQILSGANTYTGATTVNGGTLQVDGSLAAGSAVTVKSAATLTGTGAANGAVDVQSGAFVAPGSTGIGTLTLGSATLSGTYLCDLNSTTGDVLAVTGTLTVDSTTAITFSGAPAAAEYTIATYGTLSGTLPTITPPTGYTLNTTTAGVIKLVKVDAGYDSWMAAWVLNGFAGDPAAGADADSDGMKNILEYILNGNPGLSDPSILPKSQVTETDFVFTFTRRADSATGTTQVFEYGGNLVDWTPVNITGIPGVEVSIGATYGTAPDELQDITVTIPRNSATELFGRLEVTTTTP